MWDYASKRKDQGEKFWVLKTNYFKVISFVVLSGGNPNPKAFVE